MLCFHTLKQMLYQNTKLSNETDMKDGKALFYARELDAHLTARCTWEQSQQWGWWRWWCQIAFWSYEEAAYPFLHMSTPVSRWRAVKCLSACASLRSCSHRAHGLNLRLGLCLQVKLDQLIKWQSCKWVIPCLNVTALGLSSLCAEFRTELRSPWPGARLERLNTAHLSTDWIEEWLN